MSIYKISNPFLKNDSLLPAFQKEKNHACQCQKHFPRNLFCSLFGYLLTLSFLIA